MLPIALLFIGQDPARDADRPGALAGASRSMPTNPIPLASAAGLAVSSAHVRVPPTLADPIESLSRMAVPLALTAFGVSLVGAALPEGPGTEHSWDWSSERSCWCSRHQPSCSATTPSDSPSKTSWQ
jgi:hypothetical protein